MKLKKILWNLLVLLIIGYVGILAYQNISQYQRFKVNGQSMNPTLKDGQKLIMKKFQKNDKLHRGDVVIIKVTLKDKEYDFIKRVIALPGEHLEIKNHKVYINGKYLEDEGSTMGEEDCVIPDDSIYVMGDNRDHSLDSRKLGTMKISKVVARKVIQKRNCSLKNIPKSDMMKVLKICTLIRYEKSIRDKWVLFFLGNNLSFSSKKTPTSKEMNCVCCHLILYFNCSIIYLIK